MLDLSDLPRMGAFVVIVREGSLTAAAKVLGVSKASLSEQLRKLEKNVGTRLLQRTTRRFSLTEAGEAYYRRCAQMMEEAVSANAAASAMQVEPTGKLRVTAPHAMGATVVIPALVEFCLAYPEMRVDLRLSDTPLDLLENDLDLAVRGGWPTDSTLIARKLSSVAMYLCASPSHVLREGRPRSLAEVASQRWVLHSGILAEKVCVFRTPSGEREKVVVTANVSINSADAVRNFLLCGHGIGVLPAPLVAEDLAAGRLVQLLPEYALAEGGIYAVYPSRQHVPLKVQRFIEFLEKQLGPRTAIQKKRAKQAPTREQKP